MSSIQDSCTTHLLYLHGFRSSPRSAKALRMREWVAQHRRDLVFACPQLPPSPAEAMDLLETLTRDWPHDTSALMGSSLGGFYATVLAEWPRFQQSRAVLLNPAVDPARDLEKHIGEQSCWQDPQDRFFFKAEFIEQLRQIRVPNSSAPQRLLAVVAKGDEVLDWREMHARYQAGRISLLEGSDHGLSDFEDYLADLCQFLRLPVPHPQP
ncbi:YqiA/YcfP family alpha/beta fold hydrolase [Paucibacter sp. Y2R2-4]|uniref:YqiA/YcfP family alpha/beta fold hydrolase n=1 Tax=Paucibacter sp. Y2R2-4 TaxID=2893553 RepID=UPI0021E3DE3C|nr:YqiA/YcfP family alpha/beta fold hydrolase [Paucibacter sp. Y2R2-4]MCV2349824.1 esterase [Paucibacter sp. Y2R2-4]